MKIIEVDEVKSLLQRDANVFTDNLLTQDDLGTIDEVLIEITNTNRLVTDEAIGIYKKFVLMKQEAPEVMKNDLFRTMLNYVQEKISSKDYFSALLITRFLIVKSKLTSQSYYNLAEILFNFDKCDLVIKCIKLYENSESNLPLKLLTLANFYNLQLRDYKTAIMYYEQYIKIDETKSIIYTILGSLYSKAYGDLSLKDQIRCFEKAYKLKSNDRLILHSLAFNYEKLGDKLHANKFYQELLHNNPTPTDYYNYGGFLISCGDLYQGHKYLTHRFEIDDINLKYPEALDVSKKWDFVSDISNKVLLIHYEQGFGDTFMYCRFVPLVKKFAKKIIFVVQDNLLDIVKSSMKITDGIEVISDATDITSIEYDVNVALIDLPLVVQATVETIPYAEGYLSISQDLVDAFRVKYIKPSENLKVGVAYSGNQKSNYHGRDIDFEKFKNLLDIDNVDFYSFNMVDEKVANLVNLGTYFNNFSDTASAIKNMDIIVSTDNVILNLAGALGVKTFGLFNKYPNFRWFNLNGDNIGWYNSVKPIQAEEDNLWNEVIADVKKKIMKLAKVKS